MRRILSVLTGLCLLFVMALGVSAATGASSVASFATVASDGSCQVTVTATLLLEETVDKMVFPVPVQATGVTLNGSRVSAPKSDDVRNVDISRLTRGVTGSVSFNIHYSLHDVIHVTEEGLLELQVPLLSGFAYPVQTLEFSVTLPGAADALPGFVSGYHQANIEKDLTYIVEGATVSGSSQKALKDHETLTMTMMVSEEMFPQSIVKTADYHVGAVAMGICAGLALLYWLLALGNLPVWPQKSNQPPQGSNAGQLGCILGMQGLDLNLMVLDWARLGYLLIRIDRNKRVLLQKRMDMGNERSEYERGCFRNVFRKSDTVDTSQYSYAAYCRNVERKCGGIGEMIHRRTGNNRVFRGLAAGIGLFGGASLGIVLGNGAVLQWLLMVVLAAAGGVSGWVIQAWPEGLLLRRKHRLYTALALCGGWLLIGLLAEAFLLALWMVLGLLAAGALLFWAGRRTHQGRVAREQLFALRRYMKRDKHSQLQALCKEDPDYFFRMAPAALALGVDRQFARQFGGMRFSGCPYLTTGIDANMTAAQWNEMLHRALEMMDSRARQLPMEKLIWLLRSIIKG